jgi:hypothetical protein
MGSSVTHRKAPGVGVARGKKARWVAVLLGIGLLGIVPCAYALPNLVQDMCGQTSGGAPPGMDCPGPNYLLVRPLYSDGSCGSWMCCPPNPDGKTYDCSHAVNPTGMRGFSGGSLPRMAPPTVSVQPTQPVQPSGPLQVRPPVGLVR